MPKALAVIAVLAGRAIRAPELGGYKADRHPAKKRSILLPPAAPRAAGAAERS
jgi:hypothetical protein